MSKFKSHFLYTRQQRSGILVLVILIVILQVGFFFADFSSGTLQEDSKRIAQFRAEVDSLRHIQFNNNKPKIYPFNPNYITDYKGYTLGMSNEEIDRLHAFRNTNKWVNSAIEFQNVTKVSDSLLDKISPYFKFPDWVTNPKPKTNYSTSYYKDSKPKTFDQKQDLNIVTATQLKRVNGIGDKLSERIVNYRSRSGGFIADVQLQEVYGLSPEVIERVLKQFTVKTPKAIKKVRINTASIEELVTVKYIDYEIAHNIVEQRTLREGFSSFDELTKVKDFPVKKSAIIKLYLSFD